ncbi:MAG: hypothetical protein U0414_06265 [Polyangiaceae bacterium]
MNAELKRLFQEAGLDLVGAEEPAAIALATRLQIVLGRMQLGLQNPRHAPDTLARAHRDIEKIVRALEAWDRARSEGDLARESTNQYDFASKLRGELGSNTDLLRAFHDEGSTEDTKQYVLVKDGPDPTLEVAPPSQRRRG